MSTTPPTRSPMPKKKSLATCLRCGYVWEPRKPVLKVLECPRCKSYKWNKPLHRNRR